jgi:ParB/RepB/Spo0J family partition protein
MLTHGHTWFIMTSVEKSRKFGFVEAGRIHSSKLLPNREFDDKLVESIRQDGIQQPIIVRPSPHESKMFEIIDGHLRHESTQENQKVLVDVRYDVDDTEVFKLSEATFKRKPRNTYERSLFYSGWVKTVEATSRSRGAQKKVATKANLSQAEVSHYLSIDRLFKRLQSQNIPEGYFNALKNQGVNKLYALARVEDDSAMLEVAAEMAEMPDMTLEELKTLIKEQISPERLIQRLAEEDYEEERESNKIDQLTNATKELEEALDKTGEVVKVFTSRIAGNPDRFLSPSVFKKIRRLLNALKKIEKETNRIIRSGEKPSH